MPEWDSAYGASSKASFDAGKAPKGTYGGNGNKSTVTHTSTGNTNLQKASLVGSTVNFLRSGNPLGLAWQAIKSPFKKKTEKEKIAANINPGKANELVGSPIPVIIFFNCFLQTYN